MSNPTTPLANLRLGDLVDLPDGRRFLIRARCVLPRTAANIAGFVVLGELEAIVTTPAFAGNPLGLYVPSSTPTFGDDVSPYVAAHGSVRYWAPHLPSLTNAMAHLDYELIQLRGALEPHLRLLRAAEEIFFCPSSLVDPSQVMVRAHSEAAEDGPYNLRQGWSPLPLESPAVSPDRLYQRAVGR